MGNAATRDTILELMKKMGESIIGQETMIERLLLGLLANGNLLVEGLPGLAKTRAIKSLSKNLDAKFSRLQFTPDLLPADITGSEVYYSEGGTGEFKFQEGPVFANLVLADEVNRAPAKVQAALLEATEERQVTVAGQTHKLPDLVRRTRTVGRQSRSALDRVVVHGAEQRRVSGAGHDARGIALRFRDATLIVVGSGLASRGRRSSTAVARTRGGRSHAASAPADESALVGVAAIR